MTGAEKITAERERQIELLGYEAAFDVGHEGQLLRAAACYLTPPDERGSFPPPEWPWSVVCWNPSPHDRVRDLVKAGALIAAAIDVMEA